MKARLVLAGLICMVSMPVKSMASVAAPSAIDLFVQICLGDETTLSNAQFAKIGYGKIPKSAKLVIAYANPDSAQFDPSPKAYATKDVVNGFVETRDKDKVLLILPARESNSRPMSAACGVIWPGRHFSDAAAEAYKLASVSAPPSLSATAKPVPYSAITFHGNVVVAAEYANWTILHISPDITISKDETKQ